MIQQTSLCFSTLHFSTQGKSITDITAKVQNEVQKLNVQKGLCNLLLQHTSASLILCENADSSVKHDLEVFFQHLVPEEGMPYTHKFEGKDDMPAHIRSILTQNSMSLPIQQGQLALGIWQGLCLWEHRLHPHTRALMLTCIGA